MQGLTETGAEHVYQKYRSAHTSRRLHKRYGQTMAAVAIPALMAGLIAGFIMSGGDKKSVPALDLVQRADMLRHAQSKIVTPAALDMTPVQTSAVHTPVADLNEVDRSVAR